MSNHKPHANSALHKLSRKRRELLITWLFDKNISYAKARARVETRFKVKAQIKAFVNFYRKEASRRRMAGLMTCTKAADEVVAVFKKRPDENFKALEHLIGQFAFQVALAKSDGKPVDLRDLREAVELFIDTRKDRRDAELVSLDREKWEFDVVRLVEVHHAELEAISKDAALDEDARLQAIRRRIFGKNIAEES